MQIAIVQFFFYCIVFNCVCLLLHAIYLFSKITSNGNISMYGNEGQQKKLKIDRSAQRAETWFVFNVILMLTLILTTTKTTTANQINYSYFVTVKQMSNVNANCGKVRRIAVSENRVAKKANSKLATLSTCACDGVKLGWEVWSIQPISTTIKD